jgi:beta-glucanase (GH16 family)
MNFTQTLVLAAALVGVAPAQNEWRLAWSDEFEGPARKPPDSTKWAYDLGATGWGNGEIEEYTDSLDNASLDGAGNLVIRALTKASGGYTSARLKTLGRFTTRYGKIEARIRIPKGQGIWPAFWMLGGDIISNGWPNCGEIDILENIGREPSIIHGTVHGPAYSGENGIGTTYSLTAGKRFADDFHVYGVIWKPKSIEFYVDSKIYFTVTPTSLPNGAKWVFDHPFFLLLNLAVGGNWPGNIDASTEFPRQMVVDYVRVFIPSAKGSPLMLRSP